MAQLLRVFPALPRDSSLIPSTINLNNQLLALRDLKPSGFLKHLCTYDRGRDRQVSVPGQPMLHSETFKQQKTNKCTLKILFSIFSNIRFHISQAGLELTVAKDDVEFLISFLSTSEVLGLVSYKPLNNTSSWGWSLGYSSIGRVLDR